MAKRFFLQKAHTFNSEKHSIPNWLVSEKLDGRRAFWDGGITRGMPLENVPWANTAKDSRLKNQRIKATGLWSTNAKVIYAPSKWLDGLPRLRFLDGELFAGPGRKQRVDEIVARHTPNPVAWCDEIVFFTYDEPPIQNIFKHGSIDTLHYQKVFTRDLISWVYKRGIHNKLTRFEAIKLPTTPYSRPVSQVRLPPQTPKILTYLDDLMQSVVAKGGEGLMIRNPSTIWIPERTYNLLKMKPFDDSEGEVIGYIAGDNRHRNKIGSLLIRWINPKGKTVEFHLSGMSDKLREFFCSVPMQPKKQYTGISPHFPLGTLVTFKYRDLTNEGLPKEARYWRKRCPE